MLLLGKSGKCEAWESDSPRALRRIGIDNLAGLRSGNHIGKVGILVLGCSGRSLPLSDAFDAALFLVLLLLPTKLFSATFFQLVAPDTPMRLARRSGQRNRARMICLR